MATLTTNYNTTEAALINVTTGAHSRVDPHDFGGKVRVFKSTFVAPEEIAANSILSLTKLPAGRILPMTKVYFGACATGRTLDIGYNEHKKNDGTTVSSDVDAIFDGIDVAAAGSSELGSSTKDGVLLEGQAEIIAKVLGGTIAADTEITAYFFLAIE